MATEDTSRQSPPKAESSPILQYQRADAPRNSPRFVLVEQHDDTLKITLLPPPIASRLLAQGIGLFMVAIPTAAVSGMVVAGLADAHASRVMSGHFVALELLCPGLAGAFMLWGTFVLLRRLVCTVRYRNRPSTIYLSKDEIEVHAYGAFRPKILRIRRDRMIHLHIRPAGEWMAEKLWLEIQTNDGRRHGVNLRWELGRAPIAELQQPIHEFLKSEPGHKTLMSDEWGSPME